MDQLETFAGQNLPCHRNLYYFQHLFVCKMQWKNVCTFCDNTKIEQFAMLREKKHFIRLASAEVPFYHLTFAPSFYFFNPLISMMLIHTRSIWATLSYISIDKENAATLMPSKCIRKYFYASASIKLKMYFQGSKEDDITNH